MIQCRARSVYNAGHALHVCYSYDFNVINVSLFKFDVYWAYVKYFIFYFLPYSFLDLEEFLYYNTSSYKRIVFSKVPCLAPSPPGFPRNLWSTLIFPLSLFTLLCSAFKSSCSFYLLPLSRQSHSTPSSSNSRHTKSGLQLSGELPKALQTLFVQKKNLNLS